MNKLFIFSAVLAVGASMAAAQQTCTATTASVIGTYNYTATEFPFGTTVITPPGSTTNGQTYSTSQIGTLLQYINSGSAYSSANVLYFDGAGHVLVAASSSNFTGSQIVGSYTVNSDCTINVTLNDTSNTATSSATGTNVTQATASLIGIVLGGGAEIYLSVPQSSTSTNGNMPLIAGQFASKLTIELIRTYAYGCTVASLQGTYGLVGEGYVALASSSTTGTTGTGTGTGTGTTGTGTTTSTSSTVQPASFLAVVTFDGGGHIIAQTVPSGSPLASFQDSGTYTLNLNCSGTMTLSSAAASTSTTTTGTTTTSTGSSSSTTFNFVLTPAVSYPSTNAYSASPSGNSGRPGLLFTFQNGSETLMGMGIAQ